MDIGRLNVEHKWNVLEIKDAQRAIPFKATG